MPLKVGQHIYCDGILYYTYVLTAETIGRLTGPLSQRMGQEMNRLRVVSYIESMFTLCLISCIWCGGPFVEDDEAEGGVAKEFL